MNTHLVHRESCMARSVIRTLSLKGLKVGNKPEFALIGGNLIFIHP